MKNENAIEVSKLSKRYRIYRKPSHKLIEALWNTVSPGKNALSREFWALTDISLSVPRGTTMGIIGQNGSGKSTLLQIIAGVLQATHGEVQVNGRVAALLELGAGFNREFTGRENVFLQGSIMGFSKKEMERRLPEIEAFADIGAFIDQPVKTYSSGMYVRLAFAVAINVDAEILIIDEALAVGDDMFRRRCYNRIEEMQRDGKTILFVTHSLATLSMLCDKAVLLNEGRLIVTAGPSEAVKHYYRLTDEIERKRAKQQTGSHKQQGEPTGQEPDSEESGYSASEIRTGSGEAKITDIAILGSDGIPTRILQMGDTCTIRFTITFLKDVQQPLVWFSIKTISGMPIITANNRSIGEPFPAVRKGQQLEVTFKQRINLNRGAYALTVRVDELINGIEEVFLDCRMDVITFRVDHSGETYALVTNEVNFGLSEL